MTDHARTSYRNHRRATWGLVIAVVVAVAAVLVPLAAGAGGRPTTYAFTGNASACSGTTSVTFNVILTNTSDSSQNLGSADLYAPTNLSVTDANILSGGGASASVLKPIGTFPLNGETRSLIHLRNMQLPGGQTPKAAVMIQVVANVSNATAQTKSWFSMAKQANDFNPGSTDLSNSFTLSPAGSYPTFTVAACELRFVQQPPNPWQKSTTASPAVAAAVYAGSTAVASSGLNPSLGATPTGAPGGFTSGTASYNATTFVWSWPSGAFSAATPSGLYNLVLSASGYTSVKSDSNPAAGNQEAPFRVTDNNCPSGQTCNVTSNLSGPQAQIGVANTLPGSIAIDFQPGGTGIECDPWPNRLFYPDANGNPVYFPAVALDYTWGDRMLKVTYRIRNSEWLLTAPAQGNQDVEFCAQARHQDATKNNGNYPFAAKYDVDFIDGFYVGVLNTVSNPNKVKTDGTGSPAVCARGTQDIITNGVSETWRTWDICIPFDWDWGVKPG